jgi:tyrosyl-tRNA synthetase
MLREDTSQHEGKILIAKDKAKPVLLIDVIVGLGLAPSKKEARRLIEQGGVRLNDVPVTDPFAEYVHQPGAILRVGKRKVVKLV